MKKFESSEESWKTRYFDTLALVSRYKEKLIALNRKHKRASLLVLALKSRIAELEKEKDDAALWIQRSERDLGPSAQHE